MAMLWMVVVALVAACDCHPGPITDLDDELYSEVRDLVNEHGKHQVSVTSPGAPPYHVFIPL